MFALSKDGKKVISEGLCAFKTIIYLLFFIFIKNDDDDDYDDEAS
jgi:hypothetical protein